MTTGPTEPNEPTPPPSPPYGQQPAGQPPQPYGQQPPYGYGAPGYVAPGYLAPVPNDGLAIGAMVVGIVSIVLACGYGIGLLGSPAALIMGRISLKRIDRSQGRLGGRAMAMAGFVLGIIGTILLVLAIAAVVVVVVLAANGTFDEASGGYLDATHG